MKDLLYKEIKLALHPTFYIFLSFGALLLIPSWPFFIAFMYIIIAVMSTLMEGKANLDILFTVSLPVRKIDVVRAKVYSIAAFEILQIAAAVPFAVLNRLINPHGNVSGMNPNIAFFGFVFIMYAVFNAILFPMFYRKAYKPGMPILISTLAVVLFVGAVETLVHAVPVLDAHLNRVGAAQPVSQLAVLVAGILVFLLATRYAFKRASRNFDKVDL
jgi:ABC-2 type transport system permease protein